MTFFASVPGPLNVKLLGSPQLLLPPCAAVGGGGGGGGGACGRDEVPLVGGGGGGGARGRPGGLGAALEGGGGGGGGALLGALWGGVGDGVLRNGGKGGRGARVPGGGGGGGGVPRGGLVGEDRAGRRGVDEAGRLIGAGGGLRKDGDVEGPEGTEGAVVRRLGTLGGSPEGLKAAERVREGAVLLSELSEYVESRDAKQCQFATHSKPAKEGRREGGRHTTSIHTSAATPQFRHPPSK